MAPAQLGMLQCQMPDLMFKTCFSLSKVRPNGPSAYIFDSEMVVDSPVTASMHTKAFVRGFAICEIMNPNDLKEATFASEGHQLSALQAAKYRARIRRSLAPFFGRTLCTTIVRGDGGMQKVVGTVDGKRFPAADYSMKWVAPEDGWIVAR